MVIQWADVGWLMRIRLLNVGCTMPIGGAISAAECSKLTFNPSNATNVGSRVTIGGTDVVPRMLIRGPDVG